MVTQRATALWKFQLKEPPGQSVPFALVPVLCFPFLLPTVCPLGECNSQTHPLALHFPRLSSDAYLRHRQVSSITDFPGQRKCSWFKPQRQVSRALLWLHYMLLLFAAMTFDFSLVYAGVRATSLQPFSTPGHSCSICCSQMRGAHPHFTELFTICVGRIVISCSILCTVPVHFPKGCFFQLSFQLSSFTLYFCFSTST